MDSNHGDISIRGDRSGQAQYHSRPAKPTKTPIRITYEGALKIPRRASASPDVLYAGSEFVRICTIRLGDQPPR